MDKFTKSIKKYIKKEVAIGKAVIKFAEDIVTNSKEIDGIIQIPKHAFENIKTSSCVNVFREVDLEIDQGLRVCKFMNKYNIPNKKLCQNENVESVLKLYEMYLLKEI